MTDPTTPAEWLAAVTLAEVCLDIATARVFGLITGGPEIDTDRCRELIRRGRAHGIISRTVDVNAKTTAFVRELCV